LRVRRTGAINGSETEKTQYPEIVLPDALRGIADETDAPGQNVWVTVQRIVDPAVGIAVESVDGEIPASCVGSPILREDHPGMTAERLNVLPKGGHLERCVVDDDGYRAVLQSSWDRLEPRALHKTD